MTIPFLHYLMFITQGAWAPGSAQLIAWCFDSKGVPIPQSNMSGPFYANPLINPQTPNPCNGSGLTFNGVLLPTQGAMSLRAATQSILLGVIGVMLALSIVM